MKKLVAAMVLCCLVLVGCTAGNEVSEEEPGPVESGYNIIYAGSYDSADSEAVVEAIDSKEQTIRLYNRIMDRTYTLSYDGTTKFYDKYRSAIVLEQVAPGDIVDVTFVKSKKLLNSLQKSSTVWTYSDITGFTLDRLGKNLRIQEDDYRFKDDVRVFADGVKAELMDINDVDSITVSGFNHEVYSIVVSGGHGYLRLSGQDYFVGGWIEVGTGIIKPVSEDMLLTVPIGTYDVSLTNGNINGRRTVTIDKGRETLLDVSDMVTVDETQYGDIIFVTSPEEADVYIDGQAVDKSKPYSVEYGIHQLIVKADGYDTVTQYVKVGQEHATIEISLEKTEEPSQKNVPSPDVQPQVTTFVTPGVLVTDTSQYKVTVDTPEGAEVYVDGQYIGTVPTSFSKVPGSHVVTLRKEGYETRSYTITLDTLLQNETYSFGLNKAEDSEP